MVRRTAGIALLAILTVSSLLATTDALDTARKMRDRALNGRVKRNHARASLQGLARSGQYSVSQMHAVLDHILSKRGSFEGYEVCLVVFLFGLSVVLCLLVGRVVCPICGVGV